ncbi:MAG: hypothetical protein FRX48_09113 [Lasallia pustulata]|uniref:Aflatoxin biosynthesis ketoreductase nor-1 n=1 Tax=Lasallia pustulata TaxID=136370 RepID=A0A5M8PCL6_9LECA|nr:MAG: hypothetical protein FRX48_09113 [Lasallia pustulata]
MSGNTTYLITGAHRGNQPLRGLPRADSEQGIGRGLTAAYLSRPDDTVIAAIRDPSHATAKSLPEVSKGHGSALITVKLDSSVPADAATVIQSLQSEHNISALDVIIANAGINDDSNLGPVAQLSIDVLDQHVRINAYAHLLLFQAALPLLEKAKTPKFVAITSGIGSIGIMEHIPFPMGGYGASKAILNFVEEHRPMTAESGSN